MEPSEQQEPGAGGGQADSPFASAPGQNATEGPQEAEAGKEFNWFGLRNSEPPLHPRNVGDQLDVAAEWYEHLFTGFLKQSESGNTEAWMHYVMAAVLLADNEMGLLSEEDREEIAEEADGWDGEP
jgi:hypothetical protein